MYHICPTLQCAKIINSDMMKSSENVKNHGKKRVKKLFSTSLETNLNAYKVQ